MLNLFRRNRQAIAEAVNSLSTYGVGATVQERLMEFLQTPDSRSLYHANPRLIAAELKLSEPETLKTLVVALKEGIVTLNWDIQCPKCHGIDFVTTQFRQLRTWHVCPRCHHRHHCDADHEVRVTFSIDQRLRSLPKEADNPEFRQQIDSEYGIVSGHRLLTVQTFRDLFPRETMPPHESLLIRQVTILFTDLAGSTALYSQKGDSHAYSLVRQHFDLLFGIVDQHNGAVIKTIGDAIMASFTSPDEGLKAAIAMQEQMPYFNQANQVNQDLEDQLILRVGVHAGSCISVTLNDHPDYFGTTVNTAARIQALSQGHDIVCTASLQSQIQTIAKHYTCKPSSIHLKGLSEPIMVYHILTSTNSIEI